MNNPDQIAFGQKGSFFLSGVAVFGDADGEIPDGLNIVAVTALTSCAPTGSCVSDSGFASPDRIPEGVTIFGRWSQFAIQAGEKAILYFG